MALGIENAVINNVLCYVSFSLNSLTQGTVLANTVAFYKGNIIKSLKETIFKICKETPKIRKSCSSHPNPATADMEDILDLFEKVKVKNLDIP